MSALKNAIFPAVAGAVLVATAVIGGTTNGQHQERLDAQRAALSTLESKQSDARAATSRIAAEGTVAVAGARAERVTADSKVIDDLVDRTLTWSSDAEYRQARASAMRVYGLTEKSIFMRSFLPPAPVSRDSEGNVYPYIDAAGLNSQVGDTTVKLQSVSGTQYSYMVLVDVQSQSSDKQGTAVNVATVFITVDDTGKVSDLTGYASTTTVRSSD